MPKPSTHSPPPHHSDILLIYLDFETSHLNNDVILDQSTYDNDAHINGDVTIADTGTSCRHVAMLGRGSELKFDGSAMEVKPREAITLSVWLKLRSVGGDHSIFDTIGARSTHTHGQFHFEVNDGAVRWFHRDEDERIVFDVVTGKEKRNEGILRLID